MAQSYQFNGPGFWTDKTKWTPDYPELMNSSSEVLTVYECTLSFENWKEMIHLKNLIRIIQEQLLQLPLQIQMDENK